MLQAIIAARRPASGRSVPERSRLAVEKALEKDPADRYQSMRELVVDLRRVARQSADGISAPIAAYHSTRRRTWWVAGPVLALVLAAIGALWAWGAFGRADPTSLTYTPLTNFSDSAVAPALSLDGRMLAFIRGENTFVGPGDLLSEAPARRRARTGSRATAQPRWDPRCSLPTGRGSAYTSEFADTWVVPVLGGEPSPLLANASGLTWIDSSSGQRNVLFSKYMNRGESIHMGIFTSSESRAGERRVYVPADTNGMAHRSFQSPDGRHVLVVEMGLGGWLPCRLVPFDGTSPGKAVGPSPAQCTDSAWTPDGAWMYFSANTGDGFHIWRQRFPDGRPEQLTSGPAEEQGIAFAPDGRSFVTSVGESQSTIWIQDSRGERQLTSQGYAFLPSFSSDGRRLYYLQRSRANRRFVSGELWFTDVESGKRDRLLPDYLMEHYAVSGDGTRVLFINIDDEGRSGIWVAQLDGGSPRGGCVRWTT